MLDLIGRRATLLVNGIAYVVGASLVIFAPAFWMLVRNKILKQAVFYLDTNMNIIQNRHN